jgi:hypothetical protein
MSWIEIGNIKSDIILDPSGFANGLAATSNDDGTTVSVKPWWSH